MDPWEFIIRLSQLSHRLRFSILKKKGIIREREKGIEQ